MDAAGRDDAVDGLVVTLANRSRPRDMAHYEQFEHYHDTFYANVEALSVTPFSEASLERGLTGLIVSAARVIDAGGGDGASLSPDATAGHYRMVDREHVLLAQKHGLANFFPHPRPNLIVPFPLADEEE